MLLQPPQVLSPSDMKALHLPAPFGQEVDLQVRKVTLVTQHGSWQAGITGKPGQRSISGVAAALLGLKQRPGQTICLTLLGPGRLLITAEGEPQFSAVVAADSLTNF